MLCQNCQEIPLDVFLPNHASNPTIPGGKLWLGKHLHATLDEIEQSSTKGCVMCRLCLDALKNGQIVGSVPANEGSQGVEVTLRCVKEGELLVLEHTGRCVLRKGRLRWFNEGTMQGCQAGNIISSSPNDRQVYKLVKSWIKTCRKDHQSCLLDPASGFYPKRLLDIGFPFPGENPIIRLVRTACQFKAENIKYIALSHCWGTGLGAHIPRTTKSNLETREAGIHWEELSKTFQDAIQISQGLGVRFIWIDSLCIIQDDQDDFEIECAQMGMVYSNAYCTIAASDSPAGNVGCFIPRDETVIPGCALISRNMHKIVQSQTLMDVNRGRSPTREPTVATVQIRPDYASFQDSIEGPLSKRGWTLQERELSPRILYYTKDQVIWECRECTASEESPIFKQKEEIRIESESRYQLDSRFAIVSLEDRTHPDELMTNQSSWRLFDAHFDKHNNAGRGSGAILKKWYALTEAYSCRQLSVQRDKLPAISGIATEIARLLQHDEYFAGIWKSDLLRGISWFPDPVNRRIYKEWPPPLIDEGIPSWSWAAFDGPIKYYGQHWFGDEQVNDLPKIQLESVHINRAGRDPFGRAAGGELCLSGFAIEASVSEKQHESDFRGSGFQAKCYSLPASFKNPSTLRLYIDSDPETLPRIDIVCLQLTTGLSVRHTQADVGLVLLKSNHADDVYHRIGMFDVEVVDRKWRSLRKKQTLRIV